MKQLLSSLSSSCFIPPQLIHNCIWRGPAVVFKNSFFCIQYCLQFQLFQLFQLSLFLTACFQQLFKISLCFYSFKFPMVFKYFLLKFLNNFVNFALKFYMSHSSSSFGKLLSSLNFSIVIN